MVDSAKTRRGALEDFKRTARMFQSVLDMAEYLETAESLDAAAMEAESRRAAAVLIADAARSDVEKLKAESATLMAATKHKCDVAVGLAREQAVGIMVAAKGDADALKALARLDSETLAVETAANRDAARVEADGMRADLAADGGRLVAARAELALVEDRITAARAVVRGLMGA